MKTDAQLRQEIANNRKLLRERKRQALGLPSMKKRTWKRDRNGHVHEYLVGHLDHVRRRIEIYKRAGGDARMSDDGFAMAFVEDLQPANCQSCGRSIHWTDFHWHHNVKSHGGRRCDCVLCALAVCLRCHVAFHDRIIKFIQREKA